MSNPTELPGLDKIEEQVRRAYMADARFVAFLQPGTILDIIQLARRAQTEGEAPQADESSEPLDVEFKQLADTILQATTNGTRLEALRGMAELFDKQAALHDPAATLSPLCGAQVAARDNVAVRVGWVTGAQHAESGKEVAAKPPFPISDDEMAALRRFWECATDGEGYDVEKSMMQRLAEMGLVQRKSGAYYMATDFGLYVLSEYTIPRAAQLDGGQEGSESNG